MDIHDKDRFLQMLAKAMGAYDRKLPDLDIIDIWMDMLEPYPLSVIGRAFVVYCDSEPEFAPKAASIAARCKLMDGRPTADEAWAIALPSRDEAETVVWTDETARAFNACSPILDMGDEVGARRSFIDSYNRLVSEARLTNKPANWFPSPGWDAAKREAALQRAQVAGLLAAPQAREMLPNYSDTKLPESPEGLKRLKEEMAKMQMGSELSRQRIERRNQERRDAEAAKKRAIDEQVKQYQQKDES